jgi:hypothetical protein
MGSKKFVAQVQIAAMLSGMDVDFDLPRSMEVVDAWRAANPKYVEAWEFFDRMIPFMRSCGDDQIEEYGPVTFTRNKIWLPNDCAIWYSQMQGYETAYGVSWKVLRRKRWQNLHGGVIAENLTQALHRQAVFEQALLIAQEFDVVMMTHDEVSYIAPEAEADAALAYGLQCMAVRPAWMPNLPLEGEGGYDTKYSK